MFREGTSWKWRISLIILLILSSRTLSSSELVCDNFHEVPFFVLNNRTPGTAFNLITFPFPRVLNICFVLIVKASIIIQCGDVEQNQGPVLKYAECVKTVGGSFKNKVKIFSLNCRSIVGQNNTLKQLIDDLGKNTIFGFTETWFKMNDDIRFWEVLSENFQCFRKDRNLSLHDKTSGGGLLLYIPRSFKPKERSDLTIVSESRFEIIWVECQFNKKKYLINISYCPTKHLSEMFLSELALVIDCAAAENKRIILMGDYNIDFFQKNEKRKLETLFIPYGLVSCNTNIGTRQSVNKTALTDYIITENFKKCFVTESILNSGHYGTVAILDEKMMMKQKPIKKTFFDKKNYYKENFQEYIRSSDWSFFWMSHNANEMMLQFCIIVEQAINVHAPLKSYFVRNDKPKIFLNRNKFLSGKNFKSENEASLLKDFISLNTEKSHWKFKQEVRNNEKQRILIETLRNSFGELITNGKDIANLLNFKFSVSWEYFGERKKFDKTLLSADTGNANRFFFNYVTCKEVHDLIKCLNVNKPLGPSKIPAWA